MYLYFTNFLRLIGVEIKNVDGNQIKLDEILRELPEVHEIGYALDLFPNTIKKVLTSRINYSNQCLEKEDLLYDCL